MLLTKLDEVKKAYVFTVFCYLKASSTPNYDRSFDVFLLMFQSFWKIQQKYLLRTELGI